MNRRHVLQGLQALGLAPLGAKAARAAPTTANIGPRPHAFFDDVVRGRDAPPPPPVQASEENDRGF
jgi:hypothetical protein